MVSFDFSFYHRRYSEILSRVRKFWETPKSDYVPILQKDSGKGTFDSVCGNRELSLEVQLKGIENTLRGPTDWLPYLEPWHGVGVYADSFGCKYEWHENDAPWTRTVFKNADEVKNIKKPDIRKSEIMQMVLDTIRYFKKETGDEVPVCITDTQSPIDSAILIWEPEDFFVSCYEKPDIVHSFLNILTATIIEFTQIQIETIGDNIALPGHNLFCYPGAGGVAVSDDLLAVVGPKIYEEFAAPYNDKISEAFGGIAIHTCGNFMHNAGMLQKIKGLKMIDFAVSPSADPNPNNPEEIREIFKGSKTILRARIGGEDDFLSIVDKLYDPQLRLCVDIELADDMDVRYKNYYNVREKLESLSRKKSIEEVKGGES